MSVERYLLNENIKFQVIFVDVNNSPIITADGKITIRRLSDDLYFDGISSFSASPTLIQMIKVSDVNSPGWWKFNFDTDGLPSDTYIATVTDANSLGVNAPLIGESIVDDSLANAIEIAGAAAIGKATYNSTTSKLTLLSHIDQRVLATLDIKDSLGNPAGNNPWLEKIPE